MQRLTLNKQQPSPCVEHGTMSGNSVIGSGASSGLKRERCRLASPISHALFSTMVNNKPLSSTFINHGCISKTTTSPLVNIPQTNLGVQHKESSRIHHETQRSIKIVPHRMKRVSQQRLPTPVMSISRHVPRSILKNPPPQLPVKRSCMPVALFAEKEKTIQDEMKVSGTGTERNNINSNMDGISPLKHAVTVLMHRYGKNTQQPFISMHDMDKKKAQVQSKGNMISSDRVNTDQVMMPPKKWKKSNGIWKDQRILKRNMTLVDVDIHDSKPAIVDCGCGVNEKAVRNVEDVDNRTYVHERNEGIGGGGKDADGFNGIGKGSKRTWTQAELSVEHLTYYPNDDEEEEEEDDEEGEEGECRKTEVDGS